MNDLQLWGWIKLASVLNALCRFCNRQANNWIEIAGSIGRWSTFAIERAELRLSHRGTPLP